MTRLWYILIVAGIAVFSSTGCSNNQVAVTVELGEVFTIGIGQSARIAGEDMTVTFDEVIGDSRCPQSVTCVWEGVASIKITMTYRGENHSIVLNQPGLTEKAMDTFVNYTLTYSLNPYPREGESISPNKYRLTLTLTRQMNKLLPVLKAVVLGWEGPLQEGESERTKEYAREPAIELKQEWWCQNIKCGRKTDGQVDNHYRSWYGWHGCWHLWSNKRIRNADL